MSHHVLNNLCQLVGSTIVIMLMIWMNQNVNAKPEDSNIFTSVVSKSLSVIGNAAEAMNNPYKMSKEMGFELPFAKASSKTAIGNGAAFRKDEDSSEEEEENRRRRRKRFALKQTNNELLGEENLLALPHIHRDKRSPCHYGMGGGGSGSGAGTGGGIPAGGDDIDIAERRRRYYAQKRKIAARKKSSNAKKTTSKTNNQGKRKYLVTDNADTTLTRRKRQTELDDLNQNVSSANKDFQAYVNQIAEKMRNFAESVMNSMNDMAQKIKQKFSGQTPANSQEIE